jgi:hypothetical protein
LLFAGEPFTCKQQFIFSSVRIVSVERNLQKMVGDCKYEMDKTLNISIVGDFFTYFN